MLAPSDAANRRSNPGPHPLCDVPGGEVEGHAAAAQVKQSASPLAKGGSRS